MREQPKAPPKWAINFLNWFCPEELLEGILGDFIEEYEQDCLYKNPRKAKWNFVWNVLRLFHPSIIFRNKFQINFINMNMLQSHLKVALRSMKHNKFYAFINILGLSFSIAFIFLAFRFIEKENSYDKFHTQKDHIYRLYSEIKDSKTQAIKYASAVTPIPLSKDMQTEIPSIQAYTRFASSTLTLKIDANPYQELIHFADQGFLDIFDFPILEGDANALKQQNSLLISKEKAKKLFGHSNPIGRTLAIQVNGMPVELQVAGIIDPLKEKSSIPFDFLTSMHLYKKIMGAEVSSSYNYAVVENYILTNGTQGHSSLTALLTQAAEKYADEGEDIYELGIQPLNSIHLQDKVIGNAEFTSPNKLYIMAGLAILALIIAIINFITLSTSHALNRAKEMGVRNTLGALKRELRQQMIQESFVTTLIASGIGILVALSFLPTFNELIESNITMNFGLYDLAFIGSLCAGIAWINGRLQALFIIKNKAIHTIKGQRQDSLRNNLLNQGLLIFQFSISVMLIIAAIGMRLQMQYIQNKDLGYDTERLVEINMNSSDDQAIAQQLVQRYKNKLLQNTQIAAVTASMNNSREPWTKLTFEQETGQPEGLFFNMIDPNYLQTLDIEILEGRTFNSNQQNATKAILVNEALVQHFGWDNPLEQQIPAKGFKETPQIIGVIKDFHFSSLHQNIEPLILSLDEKAVIDGVTGLSTHVWPPNLFQILVKIAPGDLASTMQFLETSWKEIAPERAFVYHFVNDSLNAKYAEETRWSKVMNGASLFAIFIAWLGLLGLMRLSVQKRIKEIGIRKVLGASTSKIIYLLSQRYLILVLIGNLIAIPITWILMNKWLNSFSYRIELSPWLFLFAGLMVLVLTILSMSLQAVRAASANPVNALKIE